MKTITNMIKGVTVIVLSMYLSIGQAVPVVLEPTDILVGGIASVKLLRCTYCGNKRSLAEKECETEAREDGDFSPDESIACTLRGIETEHSCYDEWDCYQ